jgi:exo-1,4-beta-D-glucosaminidase
MTALAGLPKAQVHANAEMVSTAHGREVRVQLENSSSTLAFQVCAAARTDHGALVAPVFWSDNWIELAPGESVTLTALLPDDFAYLPVIEIDGWNVAPIHITPSQAAAAHESN